MKKILFLIALFTLMGGVNSVKAGKTIWSPSSPWSGAGCYWTAGTNTFTWQGTNDAVRAIPTGFSGDLSDYTKFYAKVSSLTGTGVDKLQLKLNCTGGEEKYVNLKSGENLIDMTDWFANPSAVTTFELWGPKSSDATCSAVLTDVYLYKPATLEFDATGKATTNLADLYTTGGLSFDSSTGVLTTDGTAGMLVIELATSVSMEYLRNLAISKSGDADIIDKLTYYNEDGSENQSWSWYKWGGDNNADAISKFKGKPIKKIAWVSNAGKSTSLKVTISSIVWQMNILSARTPNETLVEKSLYKRWTDGTDESTETGESINPDLNLNKSIDGTIFGFGTPEATAYMKLAGYQRILLEGPAEGGLRLFFNATGSAAEDRITVNKTFDSNGKIDLVFADEASLNTQSYLHLNSIKSQYGSSVQVDRIAFYKDTPDADGEYDFILEGGGYADSRVSEYLNDEDATSIKATGITSATHLAIANPNCLIVANANMIKKADVTTNADNVIVDGVCANLVLTDATPAITAVGYPFKAPVDFTATNVSYNREFVEGQASTVCLPFALTQDECDDAGKFYELTAYDGTTLTFTQITSGGTTAYKPYLFRAAKANPFSSYSDKEIGASSGAELSTTVGSGETATMTGTLARQSVNGKYGWNSDDGVFSKAEDAAVTIDAFRAYISISGESLARVATLFVDSSVTGINEVSNSEDIKGVKNFEGKVFENGKIIIFKKGMKFNANGQLIK